MLLLLLFEQRQFQFNYRMQVTMERKSFIFYKSFYDAAKELPPDLRGEVLTGIIEYGLSGELPQTDSAIVRSILALIRPMIDANNMHYVNGKRGGRPRKTQSIENEYNTKTEQNQTETEQKPKTNQTETETEPNRNLNVYVDENVNVDVNENVYVSQEAVATNTNNFNFDSILFEFFKNNRKNPQDEARRFWDYYSSQNWCKSNGAKLASVPSAVRMWQCKTEGVRFEPNVAAFLSAVVASVPMGERRGMIEGIHSAKVQDGKLFLACSPVVADSVEANFETLAPIFRKNLPNVELKYQVK